MSPNLDCTPHRQALSERIDVARRLIDATRRPQPLGDHAEAPQSSDVSREARGLAVLLLFAAYENLLTTLCRTLLETAARSRARAQRLKPGIRLFLVHRELRGLVDSGRHRIWTDHGPRLLRALVERPARELDMSLFPHDGSFMKRSQVKLFCELFDLGDPGPVLREVWERLDTVVDQRNGIAHGRLTPEEVGRYYSHEDLIRLIQLWEDRWNDFLTFVEAKCNASKFYLLRS